MYQDTTTEFSFILKKSQYGVGVFATHNIKRNTHLRLFGDLNNQDDVAVLRQKKDIPKFFEQYCIDRGNSMMCPKDFGCMEFGWFINHSKTPNAYHKNYEYYALRNIEAGEEITVNYNSLEESEKSKEDYYKDD